MFICNFQTYIKSQKCLLITNICISYFLHFPFLKNFTNPCVEGWVSIDRGEGSYSATYETLTRRSCKNGLAPGAPWACDGWGGSCLSSLTLVPERGSLHLTLNPRLISVSLRLSPLIFIYPCTNLWPVMLKLVQFLTCFSNSLNHTIASPKNKTHLFGVNTWPG